MHPHDLLDIFIVPLEHGQFTYFVTGSVASTFFGEPRLTYDVDLILSLDRTEVDRFVSYFPITAFYCPPKEIIHIELSRKPYAHFNLIHHNSAYKADVYLFTGDTLHTWAFQHKQRIDITAEKKIWIAPPEYIIIKKWIYFRDGQSQKHLSDIKKMITISQSLIDFTILQDWISHYHLEDEWMMAQHDRL